MTNIIKMFNTYKNTIKTLSNFFTPFIIYFICIILLLNISVMKDLPISLNENKTKNIIIKKCLSEEIPDKNIVESMMKLSNELNFDLYLLFGIIETTSNFNPDLITEVADKKYYGLFQLDSMQHYSYRPKSLLKPELNLKLGINDFKTKLTLSNGNEIKALAMHKSNNTNINNKYGKEELNFIENIYTERNRFKQIVDNFIKQNYDL